MSLTPESAPDVSAQASAPQDEQPQNGAPERGEALVRALIMKHAFGPPFFLAQLAAFIRDRCPSPEERLPVVELCLHDGERLDVCHVIALAPRWVALATRDAHDDSMVTVLLPYESIARIRIRAASSAERRVGFAQRGVPAIVEEVTVTPEEALRAASVGGQGSA